MIERFTRQELMAVALVCSTGFTGLMISHFHWTALDAAGIAAPSTFCLNDATANELASLPGIGPALAKRIVEDRQMHGRFLRVEDLARVKGIPSKLTARLKPRLKLE